MPITPPPEETGVGEDAAEPIPPPRSSGRSAQLIAVGILCSRIAGLVRENLIARYLGTSLFADVFRAALRGPNLLQNLLGEGTLSASFIPVYARLLEQGRSREAGRVAGAILALLFTVSGLLVLLGIALAPLFVTVFYGGFTGAKREITITCTRIIFPMTGILALSAWALAILNSHRRFLLSYLAPVVWNAAIIAALLLFGGQYGERSLVVILAWSAVLGGLLQFLVQLPTVFRLERELRLNFGLRQPEVQTTLRNALPAISGRGVVQLSGWVDQALASFMGNGAVAILAYAQTLYMLPVSLFGMSVAAAELPELARERDAAADALRNRLNAGLKQIAVLVVPSVVGYLVLGGVIVASLFQGGRFGGADTAIVTLVLAGYTVGLLASTSTRLFSSAFFALQDTRTPARIAYVRVGISAAIGLAVTLYARLVNPDHLRYAPVGLAMASGVAAWVEWALLRNRLNRQLPGVAVGTRLVWQLLMIALGAALVGRGIAFILPPWHPFIRGVLVLVPFAVLYLLAVARLGIEARIPFVKRKRAAP